MKPFILVAKNDAQIRTRWIVEVIDKDEYFITNSKVLFINFYEITNSRWRNPQPYSQSGGSINLRDITILEEYDSIDELINNHFDEFL
jgi:hypothetical protein